ncbi:MAG TPA: TRAM domain-containing protein, partial [Blastocatellia bacterium]|nr:TRAM domain-containing protein [Blastocatellia bacterium]
MKEESLQVGDVIEVTTERMAYGGDAVARHNGLAIFIPFAAPDERLRIRVVERKRNYARGAVEEILAPSASRRDPACKHFGDCGGCHLQHLTYEAQVKAKAAFVRDALIRTGRIEWPHEIEVRHAAEFGYRSRAQIKIEPLNPQKDRGRGVGFNRTSSRSVCDVSDCPVLAPELGALLESFRATVSRSDKLDLSEVEMAAGDNGVAIAPPVAGVPSGELEKSVGGAIYRFNASTFFQVNSLLLESLVSEAVEGYSGRLAIDLYAGVGLFTIPLARLFDKVIGVESDAQAARFARENVLANKQTNVEFFSARVEDWLKQFIAR